MRAKFAFIMIATSLVAAGLLVVRQQRLQAVSDMTHALQRAADDDRALWRIRIEVARRVRPEVVRTMAQALGPLQPIPRQLVSFEGLDALAGATQNPVAAPEGTSSP